METKNIGLRNIPIADTKISMIDGEKGKLIYRGYDILDLTKNSNFEEFTVNIKRLDNNFEESITLSNMHFAKFGNELGYQHYKDIFKIILLA